MKGMGNPMTISEKGAEVREWIGGTMVLGTTDEMVVATEETNTMIETGETEADMMTVIAIGEIVAPGMTTGGDDKPYGNL